jgi:hypothetical protein
LISINTVCVVIDSDQSSAASAANISSYIKSSGPPTTATTPGAPHAPELFKAWQPVLGEVAMEGWPGIAYSSNRIERVDFESLFNIRAVQ